MGNWNEDATWVRHELERISAACERQAEAIYDLDVRNLEQHAVIREEIATLKVKAGIWGGVAGAILALGIILATWAGAAVKDHVVKNEKPEAAAVVTK